ncbi:MAG: extensin family protein [Myxococcota bacterium]
MRQRSLVDKLQTVGRVNALLVVLALCACESTPGRGGTPSPDGVVPVVRPGDRPGADASTDANTDAAIDVAFDAAVDPFVVIASPMDGARVVRESIEAAEWVADVALEIDAQGVARIEVWVDDSRSGDATLTADGASYALRLESDGVHTVEARGVDEAGTLLAADAIQLEVAPPDDGSCHAMLDALGLSWEVAPATRGIADPVRVQPFFGSVSYRSVFRDEPTPLLMDCELAPRLFQLATLVEPYDIDEVIHIGVYNYRCIGGGDPDSGSCRPSQHAFARAIDIWGFGLAGSDTEFVLERDWIITEETCPGSPVGEADRVLHEIACAMWSDRIFQIILTPNYNAAHRNHFHVDMSAGSMFIGSAVAGVDPGLPNLGDGSILHDLHDCTVGAHGVDVSGHSDFLDRWRRR